MAVSAFKSNSRRGNMGGTNTNANTNTSTTSSTSSVGSTSISRARSSDNLDKKIHSRRSRSVSATSRSQTLNSSFDGFINKRDNPLFCSTSSSHPDAKKLSGGNKSVSKLDSSPSKPVDNGVGDSRRGRSVSRSLESVNQLVDGRKVMGRSLSRVDTGSRHRSVSRVRRVDPEGQTENKYSLSSTLRSKNIENSSGNVRKAGSVTTDSDQWSATRNAQTRSNQHPLCEPLDIYSSCSRDYREDATSTGSFSEAEEKTILAFSEQIESSQSDHPPEEAERVGILETVRSEVRRAISEIQGDLESSQERARKLGADLAVEEHRELEFSRILKEILPEPKNSQPEKSRQRRKTSIERRKMSRRLTEEAMNYFDECVSISTFDGSDFSSTEDPQSNSALSGPQMGEHVLLPSKSPSASTSYYANSLSNNNKGLDEKTQSTYSDNDSKVFASSECEGLFRDQDNPTVSISPQNRKFHFSLTHEPTQVDLIRHEMGNLIKMFEKNSQKDDREHRVAGSSYGDYCGLLLADETLLFEKVVLRNRIESGTCILSDTWT